MELTGFAERTDEALREKESKVDTRCLAGEVEELSHHYIRCGWLREEQVWEGNRQYL